MKRFLIIALPLVFACALAVSPSEASVIKKDAIHLNSHYDLSIAIEATAKAAFIYDALVPASIVMPSVKKKYFELTANDTSKGVFKRQRLRCRSPS